MPVKDFARRCSQSCRDQQIRANTLRRSKRVVADRWLSVCVVLGWTVLIVLVEEIVMACARRLALGMIAFVVGVVPAFSAGQPAFDGVYIARGVDSAGNEYRRAVDIERSLPPS